jgi:hypothetical protein
MEQCRYAYMKIKKLLAMHNATLHDAVRIDVTAMLAK